MHELFDPLGNPLVYAIPFFVLTMLIELAALKWLDHDDELTGYSVKDSRTSLLMFAGSTVTLTVFKLGSFVIFNLVFVYLAPVQLDTGAWWYWPAMLLALDFAYYWQHRFVHRVNVGWAAHQAHHSSEYMNFGTALRQKWNPWFEFFFWLPLPLLGFAPWTLYVAFSVNLVYQFFVHTEMIGKLPRPIEFIFNTPSHHRVHHGSDQEYLDRNYAGMLIIWDRMFGTFIEERQRPTYGLTKQVDTYNVLTLEYRAFADILRNVRSSTRFRDRLGYVFGPPGWEPASNLTTTPPTLDTGRPESRPMPAPEAPSR
ncbi:sterol desaturase family protein (plasmid) [Rhodococcus pseudokoreensis]|uniref:Sterol desaturase family protein n=1 Tax=Rhodococcus pseudokoreensis TaxID=2811421 RepID=A0A974ZS44_9NOCA|nr:sterol desaturase family protein [Rhodococcus pseudokoreensis]QSE88017.1 sterol desaturase family protein [Rhodococcus pseudokoreensis]